MSELLYISGISPRCGSNFLYKLLQKHQSCFGATAGEDYFVLDSNHLVHFANSVYERWNPRWPLRKASTSDDLLQSLGDGLVGFLKKQREHPKVNGKAIPIAKTPHVRNISYFPKLFPKGFVVVLIRDGRAVTESMRRTWDHSFDTAVRKWKTGAGQIDTFVREHGWSSNWHCVVRYEDLVQDPEATLRALFDNVGLDPESYPYGALQSTKVVGSSTFGVKEGKDNVWNEREPEEGFDPLNRFSDWTTWEHQRFEWLAGKESEALGYSLGNKTQTLQARAHHALRDSRYALGAVKRSVHSVIKHLQDATRKGR